MNAIKQLFRGVKDKDLMHHKFVRFGKGDFERFMITIKKGKTLKIKASFDWANDLFEIIADNIKEEAEISGKIIAFRDFEKEVPCEVSAFSKRGKVYTAELKGTAKPDVLKKIYEQFKADFLLVNIKSSNHQLKCGKSLPKPGGTIKEDFCSATLPPELLGEFAFGIEADFSEAKIKHALSITDIEVPEQYKNDPAQARVQAIRKGTIKRIIDLDGKVTEKEIKFAA